MIFSNPKTALTGVFRALAFLLLLLAAKPSRAQSVSGNIHRNSGTPVPGVTVNMTGSATGSVVTGAPGNYQFSGLAAGSNITITPGKDIDPTECVSVRDMIFIGKHIFGIAPLPTPYSMIAADVNKSFSITSFDILEIRKLILGIYTQFPAQTSWTFVPASFAFSNPSNPFDGAIPASISISNLQGNVVQDFIAVKTGDATDCVGDAPAPAFLTLSAGNAAGTLGQQVLVPVTAQGFSNVSGLQFSMQWDPALLQLNQVTNLSPLLSAGNFNLNAAAGKLSFCWASSTFTGQTVPNGTKLFDAQFTITGSTGSVAPVTFVQTPTKFEVVNGACLPFGLNTVAGGVQLPGAPVQLSAGNPVSCGGEPVYVPVRVSDFQNIRGGQFGMSWNPALFQYMGVQDFGLPGMNNSSFLTANTASGALSFFWSNGTGVSLANGDTLFTVCLKPIGPNGSTTPFAFTNPIEFVDAGFNTVPVIVTNGSATISPAFTLLACNDLIQVTVDANCQATVMVDDVIEGDCPGYATITIRTPPNGPIIASGVGTVTFNASAYIGQTLLVRITENNTGNSCFGSIHINGLPLTGLICPPNLTLSCDANPNPPATGVASPDGNCAANVSALFNDMLFQNGCPQARTILRTWSAADGLGNNLTCVQTIDLQDFTTPFLDCPPNFTVSTDAGQQTATVSLPPVFTTDNCDPSPVLTIITPFGQSGFGPFTNVPVGNHTVVYTASDACGNLISCSVTVSVLNSAGCCASQQAFDALVAQGFTSVHQQCGVTVQPNGLGADCHRVTYTWGDGSSSGPLPGTATGGHVYGASGFFTVCAHVEEIGANGQACFSRDTCWGICVVCDTCSNPVVQNVWAQVPAQTQNFSGSNAQYHVFSDPLNGDFYATGHFQGTYVSGSDILSSHGGLDAFVAKYKNDGTPVAGFPFSFGSTKSDQGTILRPAPGGGFYLGGLFRSDSITVPSPGPGGYPARHLGNAGTDPHADAFLARYDAQRNLLWAFALGFNWSENLNGMAVDADSNVYISGISRSNVDFNPLGPARVLPIPLYAPYVAKYAPDGQLQWVRTLYDTSQANGGINLGLALDANTDVYVGGEFYGTPVLDGWPVQGGGFPATGLFTTIASNTGTGAAYVAKFNTQGDFQWAFDLQNATNTTHGSVWDIEVNPNTNTFFIAGATSTAFPLNFDPLGSNVPMQSTTLTNGNFLARYDLNGHGQKVVSFLPNRGVYEIEIGPSGQVYAAGTYGNSVMMASVFDADLNLKKELQTGTSGAPNDLAWSIAPDPFGDFAVAGIFTSTQFDADPQAADGPEYTVTDGQPHFFLGKYNCQCPAGAAAPCNTLCDSIQAVISDDPTRSGCCHHLQIDNQKPGAFAYVNLCVLSGGDLQIPVGIESGWSVQGYTSTNIYFVPDAGSIGVGLNNVAYFCLQNLTGSAQVIEVKYYDAQQQVLCRDTITLHCTGCVQAIVDSVYCNGWGHYQFDVCVKAGETLGYAANSVTLVPLGGATFDNSVFPLPNLAPGDTYCHLTVAVNNVLPGQQVCFYAIIHDENVAAGEPDTYCCADTVPVCFPLPDCDACSYTYASAEQVGDSCCWKITLHNPPAFFTGLSTEIITPGVDFSSIGNYAGSGWIINTASPFAQDHVWWKPVSPQGAFIQDGYMLPTVCLGSDGSGLGSAAQEMVFSWLGQDSSWCLDTLALECPISDNPGAGCLQIQTTGLNCTPTGVFQWNFNLTNLTDPGVMANLLELSGVLPAGSIVPTNFYGTFSPGSTTPLSAILQGNSGDRICFHVTLHQANDDSLHLNCCSLPDTMCVVLPNCFPSIGKSFTVNLFPNPVADLLHLAFSAPLPAPATVRVLDITGRPVCGRTDLPAGLEQTVLHLGQLTDGMYLADIQVTGLVAIRKRFIVQRGGVEWKE